MVFSPTLSQNRPVIKTTFQLEYPEDQYVAHSYSLFFNDFCALPISAFLMLFADDSTKKKTKLAI